MHITVVNLILAFSPFIMIATVRSIWNEGRSRSLMMRMLPPERRPARASSHRRNSHRLWTLRDCQMELLTDGTMHAFEANAAAYKPDRIALNYRPGGLQRRVALHGADAERATSILLRTMQRSADMLNAGSATGKPVIDDSAEYTLSYTHSTHPAHIPGVA